MKICIFGAASFIGTNLSLELSKNNYLRLIDINKDYFINNIPNSEIIEDKLDSNTDFDKLLDGQDIVYHLFSTNNPSSSNIDFEKEIMPNIEFSIRLLESCVKNNIKRVIFISSGGAIYDMNEKCPLKEDSKVNPKSTYGLQKLMIEKLLYLYNFKYNLDYKIVRLSNPYGPYQRPGILGVVSTSIYNALNDKEITIYGDGKIVRDFIYIDDAIRGIINISNSKTNTRIYNLGTGIGTSINDMLMIIEKVLNKKLNVKYSESRKIDYKINYLNVSLYENEFGKMNNISLEEGIKKTIDFMNK